MQQTYDSIDKEATNIMLTVETNCVPISQFHTPWSVPLIKTNRTKKNWNLKLSLTSGPEVSPSALEVIRNSADLKNYISTREHVIIERNLSQVQLQDLIANADKIREVELRKRAEESAKEGNVQVTNSYKTLIKHEKCRAKWRKIKYLLNKGDTEPLTRLLMQEQGTKKVLTDGENIQKAIIYHSIKHFSEAENTPLGQGTHLHDVIGPHGTLVFCDRTLDGGLGEANKEAIN